MLSQWTGHINMQNGIGGMTAFIINNFLVFILIYYGPLYNPKPTDNRSLELFINNIEDVFNPVSLVFTLPNISKREQNAIKEIKSWYDQTIRVQDKGSRFVILEYTDNNLKIKQQIQKNSFKQFPQDPSKKFEIKAHNWIEKWHSKTFYHFFYIYNTCIYIYR